jgi:hypothetical protein
MSTRAHTVPTIEKSILLVRGHRILLDSDLALLYGVATKGLVQAVKRNLERFPKDFMFQLTNQELPALRSQIVTSSAAGREVGATRRMRPRSRAWQCFPPF